MRFSNSVGLNRYSPFRSWTIGCTICILQITACHPSGTNSGYCLEQILEDLIPVEYSVQIRMLVFSSQVVLLFYAVTLGCLSNLPVIILRFSFNHVHKADECSVTAANCWAVLELQISYRYRGADKSLARPTSRCILYDGENISF
jgi:hypothetical protein